MRILTHTLVFIKVVKYLVYTQTLAVNLTRFFVFKRILFSNSKQHKIHNFKEPIFRLHKRHVCDRLNLINVYIICTVFNKQIELNDSLFKWVSLTPNYYKI